MTSLRFELEPVPQRQAHDFMNLLDIEILNLDSPEAGIETIAARLDMGTSCCTDYCPIHCSETRVTRRIKQPASHAPE